MEKIKRKLFFWTLVILFLVIAPTVVLHARGYRFDVKRGVFVYSGTITFKSNPINVGVSVNGEMNDSKKFDRINNSYNITGLLPGEYEVEISSPGFNSWKKKYSVRSGLATEFWNVVLTRKSYEPFDFKLQNAQRFYVSPWSDMIAVTGEKEDSIILNIIGIDEEETQYSHAIEGWKLAEDSLEENVEWSPEGDMLSIPAWREVEVPAPRPAKRGAVAPRPEKKIERAYLIVNIETGETKNFNELVGVSEIRKARWNPDEKYNMIFIDGKSLKRADALEKNDPLTIAEEVSAFDLSKKKVYFIKLPNNLLYASPFDGSSFSQLTYAFPAQGRNIEKIIVYDEKRVALIDNEKKLFIFNQGETETYFRELGEKIEGIHFSDDGKKALFWSGNEIFVYFLRKWEVQPAREENEIQNITRYFEPIKNVQWYRDYEHIIFSSGSYAKIIELDPRDKRNCLDLIAPQAHPPFIRYSGFLERLYYTEKSGETATLKYIDFPEEIPFLGVVTTR